MNISIFGLGYVGVVTAGCLARNGHSIIGVDVSSDKVAAINDGRSPVIEDQLEDLIRAGQRAGRLRASTDAAEAVTASEMAIVCVGTPSASNGSLSTRFVEGVVGQIGALLRGRTSPFTVVVRSTILPGTMRALVVPALERACGGVAGREFEALFHPEFLREGTSVKDFDDPPKIIVGERVAGAGTGLLELYRGMNAPVFSVSYEVAEMVKYCDNIFHALKITFANEIGHFCHAHGVNSREVMEIFCSDTKLNLSPRYLRPGFAFGGSCLPKDLRAFLYAAKLRDVNTPMLASVLPSNKSQIETTAERILATHARRVAFWGLAFKPGTDDLRESPLVTLAELLTGKGLELRIHDEFVNFTRLVGGNRAYVEQHLPHLAKLLVAAPVELDACELVVLGHPAPRERIQAWLDNNLMVFDLTGMKQPPTHPRFQQVN
ncbi:MAG: nucleotide sugar dehydrogenase [Limisphaerales bacterium]